MGLGGRWRNRRSQDRKERRSGGGGKKWSLRLIIGTVPTKIRLARPEELYTDPYDDAKVPYLRFDQHYVPHARDGKGAFLICAGDECVTCAYTSPQEFGLDIAPDSRLAKCKPKPAYGVAGWIEEPHHLVDYQTDDGKEFKKRERCQGRGCEFCKDGFLKVYGNRFFTSFSDTQWNEVIFREQEKVERMCRCGGAIYVPEYLCQKCNNLLIDVCNKCDCGSENIAIDLDRGQAECQDCQSTWSIYEADNPAIMEQASETTKCQSCNHEGLPMPNFVCSEDGCKADPYDVFDCQLTIKKASNQKTADTVIEECVLQDPDPRLFDPKYQGGDEVAEQIAESMKTVLDLREIFSPDPPSVQAQRLGVKNPFGGGDQEQNVKRYVRN